MADKNNDGRIVKNNKQIMNFDTAAKNILSIIDKNYSERKILSSKDAKIQNIINRELDIAKGVSNGSVVDFVASLKNNGKKYSKEELEVDTASLFTKDIGDIFGYFEDIYKNKYIEMSDLKFISKFIPAIGEAVKTTLDAIVSSDDISGTITRNIQLSSSLTNEDKDTILNEIEKLEDMYRLPKKLKNIVYKKSLVTGSFYVYAISYKELFEEYTKLKNSDYFKRNGLLPNQNPGIFKKNSDKGFNMRTNESFANTGDINSTIKGQINSVLESVLSKENKAVIENAKNVIETSLATFTVDTESTCLYAALEGIESLNLYRKAFPSNETLDMKDMSYIPDGTKNSNGSDTSKNAFNVSGTYIKYIDSKNIIPIKIFNELVGYYHIHTTTRKKNTSTSGGMLTLSNAIFTSTNLTEKKKEDALNNIVDEISSGIMKNFSSKFVEQNSEFKQIIADCIIANGIIDNDYRIQFIPAQHVVPFIINEDENGNGESMLADSLFPAKLLLSLIICKMLNYMNKSGNKTIAHVHKGPIDVNSSNQVQRVVRMLQETNITFNDLLSTNLVFSKFTRDSNIQLPTSKNGNKLVEFEVQEGQNIDLKTDMEDKLEQMAILGTGVPSVIMEYVNQADFAKQIVSANIKFAGRISSLQADLEEPTSDLYKILIKNSDLDEELKKKCLNSFYYKLPRPKVLTNANNSEYLSTLLSTAETVANIFMGQSGNDDPKSIKIKDELIKGVIIDNAPFFNWDNVNEIYEKAKIKIAKEEMDKKKNSGTSNNADSSYSDNTFDEM